MDTPIKYTNAQHSKASDFPNYPLLSVEVKSLTQLGRITKATCLFSTSTQNLSSNYLTYQRENILTYI